MLVSLKHNQFDLHAVCLIRKQTQKKLNYTMHIEILCISPPPQPFSFLAQVTTAECIAPSRLLHCPIWFIFSHAVDRSINHLGHLVKKQISK